ncbi:hypothetical protein JX265_007765 [Neoarthrinium moseri]|uniref:G-protein coupled receptors family 2 profile 2 domain-containing protein n=1 Tax=Neoarthrinium moseri TaxID=1658444 RepID=A0A9Q0AKQ0_9PEZI|nr:uncharacterized protein JN550_003343 [Neoarthrinium moseri]KAI1866464.1 hypothetical protein JX265_007765 [Neoarthrinium moseri]KAI1873090.1 hypothetical protein JN550_003343 [Neoarthrinium moseri]
MSETAQTASGQTLTPGQIEIIVAFERAGASLSILALLLIFGAFAALKRLRTVPNTFIVFASFANLGASVACLMGYNGVQAGKETPLCQAQAFMFELFMQSDPWWSFAMAVNVYMVFFFAANPKSFLCYWWAYVIVCYGIPLIPSLWLLLVHDEQDGSVYGDATRLFVNAASMGGIAAQVTQTTTIHHVNVQQDPTCQSSGTANWFDSPTRDTTDHEIIDGNPLSPTYHTVTHITASRTPKEPWHSRLRKAYTRWCSKFSNMDPIKLAYLRTSFVFAISVLVTWTPSSINRVHDLVARSGASFGLNLASGIVLPLQGVWNAVIFFSTSWRALKEEILGAVCRAKGLPRGHQAASAVRNEWDKGLELDQRPGRICRDDAASEVTGSTMRIMRDGSLSSL